MKNIHVIPTDKPSRLYYNGTSYKDANSTMAMDWYISSGHKPQNIYITSNEKPKAGDWSIYQNKIHKCIEDIIGDEFKKIILTTDQDLIKDGVQSINDEFLEWFVNNPSCEEVEVDRIELNTDYRSDWKQKFRYKLIIPKEKPKQETLEEAIKREYEARKFDSDFPFDPQSFKLGAKWQAKRMYSEEEVKKLIIDFLFEKGIGREVKNVEEWFEQFKKK